MMKQINIPSLLHCKKYKLKIQNVFIYLSSDTTKQDRTHIIMAQVHTTATSTATRRITTPRDARLMLGQICTFMSKGVREYGRIVKVTSTSIRIERMQQTASGEFIPHPSQENSVTKNVITFSRKITPAAVAVPAATATTTNTDATVTVAPELRGGIKRRYPNAQSTQ